MDTFIKFIGVCLAALIVGSGVGVDTTQAETVAVNGATRHQVIDGFGACISSAEGQQSWWQNLYLDDFGASVLRIDLVPTFKAPWSDNNYFSPWFRGRNNQPYAFNYEISSAQNPRFYTGAGTEFVTVDGQTYYNGPDGNRARTYTGPNDYGRLFGNQNAPIAVMGPNIDDNIQRYFNVNTTVGETAQDIINAAKARDASLSRFKLIGAIWSPAPWLKVSSGNSVGSGYGFWPFASTGTPYPYISGGNFVGGRLDTSGTPLAVFNDAALPAAPAGDPNAGATRGNTSALTQFARCTAAFLRAMQDKIGTRFYGISIQNELNFETFYNSCTYPLSSQYIAALKAVRAELNKYDDLRDIIIMGPEDLLADSTYALWQFGGGATTVHKNLQYLQNIRNDSAALAAIGMFCIHGYASDGTSSSGADPIAWERWANGWSTSPAPGIPSNVRGFRHADFGGRRSWMTETSGEANAWLSPGSGFPSNGGWSIALKINQALVEGWQSGWVSRT